MEDLCNCPCHEPNAQVLHFMPCCSKCPKCGQERLIHSHTCPPKQSTIKQVIVMRGDLRNTKGNKLHTGKLIAQGSHASLAFITRRLKAGGGVDYLDDGTPFYVLSGMFTPEEQTWMVNGRFTKVTLVVWSEAELQDIYMKCQAAGIEAHLIIDSGLTEFGGVPTATCLGIGPDKAEKIDPITQHLSLF